MDEYLEAMEEDMAKVMEALAAALGKVRTGRATPKLLDGVQVHVSSYGATMPLNQLATVTAPDARLLVVTPWDKTTLSDCERGIVAAGLGLTPSNDGQLIRGGRRFNLLDNLAQGCGVGHGKLLIGRVMGRRVRQRVVHS